MDSKNGKMWFIGGQSHRNKKSIKIATEEFKKGKLFNKYTLNINKTSFASLQHKS